MRAPVQKVAVMRLVYRQALLQLIRRMISVVGNNGRVRAPRVSLLSAHVFSKRGLRATPAAPQ